MRALFLALLLALVPAMTWAEQPANPPMTADQFDAYTSGKTLTWARFGKVFGIEEFLPDRRVRYYRADRGCRYGQWYEKDGLICFTYDDPQKEYCWSLLQDGDKLIGRLSTYLPEEEPVEARLAAQPANCADLDVGV